MLLQTLGVGVLGYYVSSFLDFSALEYISAQFDRLILLTYPFFVVLFGAVFFKRRITPAMIAALLVSYVGIAHHLLARLRDRGRQRGAGRRRSCSLASIAYAGYQILAKPLIDKLGPQLFTSIAMSAAGPGGDRAFPRHPPGGRPRRHRQRLPADAGHRHGVRRCCRPIASRAAIGLIGPERTAIIGNVSPVVTVALAIGILGEAFTVWHAVGTALVLGGVFSSPARASQSSPTRRSSPDRLIRC